MSNDFDELMVVAPDFGECCDWEGIMGYDVDVVDGSIFIEWQFVCDTDEPLDDVFGFLDEQFVEYGVEPCYFFEFDDEYSVRSSVRVIEFEKVSDGLDGVPILGSWYHL